MTTVANNNSPHLTLVEQASTPSTPAAGKQKLFIDDADHKLKRVDESDVVTEIESAPGRVLISSQTPTGVGTITFSTIPGSYSKLVLEYVIRGTDAAANVSMDILLNNDSTDANYRSMVNTAYDTNIVAAGGADNNIVNDGIIGGGGPSNEASYGIIELPFYAGTTFNKQVLIRHAQRRDTSSVHEQVDLRALNWENASAVNRIDLVLSAGNFATGSKINLYGEL